eukprot:8496100-Lingulodinium_polyedra.AAC.1
MPPSAAATSSASPSNCRRWAAVGTRPWTPFESVNLLVVHAHGELAAGDLNPQARERRRA